MHGASVVAQEGGETSGGASKGLAFVRRQLALVYITRMRFMRRVKGVDAARKAFTAARRWEACPPEVYVGAALLEWHTDNNVAVARNVFELAVKKFPHAPSVAVAYVDFLDSQRDDANARALCERALDVLPADRAAPMWARYLALESSRGDLVAVGRVNARRRAAMQGDSPAGVDVLPLLLQRYTAVGLEPAPAAQAAYIARLADPEAAAEAEAEAETAAAAARGAAAAARGATARRAQNRESGVRRARSIGDFRDRQIELSTTWIVRGVVCAFRGNLLSVRSRRIESTGNWGWVVAYQREEQSGGAKALRDTGTAASRGGSGARGFHPAGSRGGVPGAGVAVVAKGEPGTLEHAITSLLRRLPQAPVGMVRTLQPCALQRHCRRLEATDARRRFA